MSQNTINQTFIECLEVLKKNGISNASVERKLKAKKGKLKNIKSGQSSADIRLLTKLIELYPYLSNNIDKVKEEITNYFKPNYTDKYMDKKEFDKWQKTMDQQITDLKTDIKLIKQLLNNLLEKQ